jgi:hypothetical protein
MPDGVPQPSVLRFFKAAGFDSSLISFFGPMLSGTAKRFSIAPCAMNLGSALSFSVSPNLKI